MKNILYILSAILILSCTKDEKYEGTPLSNNLTIETITGSITSGTAFALPGQLIDFNFTIPQEFVERVNQKIDVEVQTLTIGGSIRTTTVSLNAGQNTGSGQILVGGGNGTFFMPVNLKLTAVKLEQPLANKHFLLTSPNVSIDSGVTSVPADDDTKLQIKVHWDNLSSGNIFNVNIKRTNSTALNLRGSLVNSTANIKINGGANITIAFDTDLKTTVEKFIDLNKASIEANYPVTVTSFGRSIFFTPTIGTVLPTIAITPNTPNNPLTNATRLSGTVFTNFDFANPSGNLASDPKIFAINNSQSLNELQPGLESVNGAYNEGNFTLSLSPKVVENPGTNLNYRIIIRRPNGEVLVSNGTYANATANAPLKPVLTFRKTGYGDNADFHSFIFLP